MFRRFIRFVPLVIVICAAQGWCDVPATQPVVPQSFMRFVDDGHQGGSLQTADVEFRNSAGASVHLVGAIHIGEESYYDALNRDFQGYDAVLYEMIKSRDVPPPSPGEGATSDNPISQLQRLMKDSLDLDYQLDDIDYTAPNFVHADMDKETFEKMQEERGETFEMIFMRMMMKAFTNPPPVSQAESAEDSKDDLISILTHPDMERQIKVVLARQLTQIDFSSFGLDGPGGSVLVTERNKVAIQTLSDTLASGKKKIAIFYGAAHMPDMSSRLEAMGFQPVATHWNVAWDLTIRSDQPSAMEMMLRKVSDLIGSDN